MNGERRQIFFKLASAWVDSMRTLDRGTYANKCMYALMDNQPMPSADGLRLTRTGTVSAESRAVNAIKDRIIRLMHESITG